MPDPQSSLRSLKSLSFADVPTSFWVVRRSMRRRVAVYDVRRVETEKQLRHKLRSWLVEKIRDCTRAEPYAYETADQDSGALTLPLSETDFADIRDQIDEGSGADSVSSYEEMVGSWGYVFKVETSPEPVYAFRQTSKLWTARRVRGLVNLIFRDEVLVDLEDENVFRVDRNFDFVGFGGDVFVLNKTGFEAAMNFREGMVRRRDVVLDELHELKRVHDITVLRRKVGDNLYLLRRVAEIHKRGYYKDSQYMKDLADLIEDKGWALEFEGGAIIVTDENVDLVLTLLGNDRLTSEVNYEEFDVRGSKKKVNPQPG